MKFGKIFLGLKVLSLGLRALVFLSVLIFSESFFGANHLMSFVSVLTVAGIGLGFGASDSVAVSSDSQAKKISRLVLPASLIGIAATLLLLLDLYWISLVIACLNYGLSFWNVGLIRRYRPVLYEKITNFNMLILWVLYLIFLSHETPDLKILSLLHALNNGILALISFGLELKAVHSEPCARERSLYKLSVSKLTWEISYSCLTRLPFILTGANGSLHSAFSYAYLLFEMASALLSHYQTVFLKSSVASIRGWLQVSSALLAVNAFSLLALVIALRFQQIGIDLFINFLGLKPILVTPPLMRDDIANLTVFMLAITALQSAAFGRYALKLEAKPRVAFIAAFMVLVSVSISKGIAPAPYLREFVLFGIMLLAGLLLVALMFNNVSDETLPKLR